MYQQIELSLYGKLFKTYTSIQKMTCKNSIFLGQNTISQCTVELFLMQQNTLYKVKGKWKKSCSFRKIDEKLKYVLTVSINIKSQYR